MINKELRVPNYLTEPMPLMKQWRLCDEDGYLEGNILFDMSELITGEEEELLDLMSNRLVGDPLLSDISYKAIGIATDGSVIVNVRGNIENCDPTTSDLETVCEQIKVVILNGGEDVIRDFLEKPIYGKSEKEIEGTVDEVLKSMPILDLIKYFKKYVAPNHYISKKQQYYVTMKVEGRFIAEVFAKNIKEAKNLATSQYMDADFGKLEDIDGDCIMVEDMNGNYLWETGDPDPEE